MANDPSAVLAAIRAELSEARGVDLVDFNTITLLADALQAVLDLHGRVFDGANTAICSECMTDFPCETRSTITTALAKGETS